MKAILPLIALSAPIFAADLRSGEPLGPATEIPIQAFALSAANQKPLASLDAGGKLTVHGQEAGTIHPDGTFNAPDVALLRLQVRRFSTDFDPLIEASPALLRVTKPL